MARKDFAFDASSDSNPSERATDLVDVTQFFVVVTAPLLPGTRDMEARWKQSPSGERGASFAITVPPTGRCTTRDQHPAPRHGVNSTRGEVNTIPFVKGNFSRAVPRRGDGLQARILVSDA
jgi:hypothetical protein